jgi:bifunctional DNase/RNase
MKLSRRTMLRLAGAGAVFGGASVLGWRFARQSGFAQAADDLLPVKVKQVYNDPIGAKVVVLAPEKGEKVLRVWVGESEALAIAATLNDISFPRPMTHDLFYAALQAVKAKVERVVIHDLRDNTFYATLVLRTSDGLKELDARPSDSIALALRAKAPIFLTPKVQAAMEVPGQEELPPSPPQRRRGGIRT